MVTAVTQVAVIGGGVVGCAVAHALARRGVHALLLEAEPGLALGASGANSGILHTGFDSPPGALETRLILRSARLREQLLGELGVPVWRCGALLTARDRDERATVIELLQNARANAVEAELRDDGSLHVPGESVTDPVAFVQALAAAARAGGATVRLGAPVAAVTASERGGVALTLRDGERLHARAAVNCAGLHADTVARMAGDEVVEVYPRKGEFVVLAMPAPALERILLPVPSTLGKGVLVFPTVDRGAVVAGPTAREREDKHDWTVEADAQELVMAKAIAAYPPLARAERIGAYAGLRPAGRGGANYVIERSPSLPGLIHVAAIRSTGLSASLGIGEHVAGMLAEDGAVELGPVRALPVAERARPEPRWWERAARHHASTPLPS